MSDPFFVLVGELTRAGVAMSEENGGLKYRAPAGAVTPEVLEKIRRNKPALLAFVDRLTKLRVIPDSNGVRVETPVSIRRLAYTMSRARGFPAGYNCAAGEPAWLMFCRDGDEYLVGCAMVDMEAASDAAGSEAA